MRKLAAFSFSFAAAVFAACFLLPEGWLPYAGGTALCLEAAGLFLNGYRRQGTPETIGKPALPGFFGKRGDGRTRLLTLICLAGLTAGFLWSWVYGILFFAPARELDGRTAAVCAVAADFPEKTDYGSKITVLVKNKGAPYVKTTLYVSGNSADMAEPGDRLAFEARFSLATRLYDEEVDYFTSKGVFLFAYASGEVNVEDSAGLTPYFPVFLKKALNEKISEIFPEFSEAFMRALLTGDRTLLREDDLLNSNLSTAGIAHVVAVSGMHISFLAGFISLLCRKRRLASIITIPIILLFMAVAGNTPSVVRAGILHILLLFAPLVRRESDSVTSFAFALALLLAFNPYSAANAGLQLSFAAVAGIMLFSQRIYGFFTKRLGEKGLMNLRPVKWPASFIAASFSATVGATVFTVPLTAIYFGYVSIVTPLTNLLTLPAVSFSFTAGLTACVLGFISAPLGAVAAWPAAAGARYICSIAKALASLPYAALYMDNRPSLFWLIYVYVMFFAVLMLKGRGRRLLLPAGLAAATLISLLLAAGAAHTAGNAASVTALDIGQGQCIVLVSGEHSAVIDCGGDAYENAGDTAAGYLLSIGQTDADMLILTHFHSDHANGAKELMSRLDVGRLVIPGDGDDRDGLRGEVLECAGEQGTETVIAAENMELPLGSITLTIFEPIGDESENERGLIILCRCGNFEALITGDVSAETERRLIDRFVLPDIELLVAGHHGSKTSTSPELLGAVRPETAIISVGANNSYGHPADETLRRLDGAGADVYRTDISGNITVLVKEG